MEETKQEKKIIIVGAGFAGISAALELSKKNLPNTKIILISDKPHLEFHPSSYRILTGHSPLAECIPLNIIFKNKNVEVLVDKITEVDVEKQELKGGPDMVYHYDYLVLGLGSVVNFYNIEGLEKYSYNINTVTETLRLKRHLHESFSECENLSKEEKTCNTHIVIVGAGPSGCEVAGEIGAYTKKLAKKHGLDPAMVKIDLIHSGDRILSFLPESVTTLISNRLKELGVNIMLNKRLMKEDIETIYFPDIQMKTKTLIWTAGVKPNPLYSAIKGLTIEEKGGRVKVDEHLSAYKNVYVVGDGASTTTSGTARPAINMGAHAARAIADNMMNRTTPAFVPTPAKYILPIAEGWAITDAFGPTIHGSLGWLVKRARDMRYFSSILPLNEAIIAFRADTQLTESCEICSKA